MRWEAVYNNIKRVQSRAYKTYKIKARIKMATPTKKGKERYRLSEINKYELCTYVQQ